MKLFIKKQGKNNNHNNYKKIDKEKNEKSI